MQKKDLLLIILGGFLFISVGYNMYFSNQIKKQNFLLETHQKAFISGFQIHQSGNLIIDYPEFIKNQRNNLVYIEEKLSSQEDLFLLRVENINGTDFDFLESILNEFSFFEINFSFDQYNDEDNYIFDILKSSKSIGRIEFNFRQALQGKNTLKNTFLKIKDIVDGYQRYMEFGIFSGNFQFHNTYILSQEELEIISQMQIDRWYSGGIKFENLSDNAVIEYLRSTSIPSFYYDDRFEKDEGKIYKLSPGERGVIKEFIE